MAYQRTNWLDRMVERPRTFKIVNNPDGTVTLTPEPGIVVQEGTLVNAQKLNNIEDGIAELFTSVSDGKSQLETAITDQQGMVSKAGSIATFSELESGIRSIPVGKYDIGDVISPNNLQKHYETVVAPDYELLVDYLNMLYADADLGDGDPHSGQDSPVGVDSQGCLIVPLSNKHVLKIDQVGEIIWDITLTTSWAGDIVHIDPVDDSIFISLTTNNTVKLSGLDGSVIWDVATCFSDIVVDPDHVDKPMFVNWGYCYGRYDRLSGSQVWYRNTSYDTYGLDARDGTVLVGRYLRLYKNDYSNTTQAYYAWKGNTEMNQCLIAPDGDFIFVVCNGSASPYSYALEKWNNTLTTRRWSTELFTYQYISDSYITGMQRASNDDILVETSIGGFFRVGTDGTMKDGGLSLLTGKFGVSPDRNKIAFKTGTDSAVVRSVKGTSVTYFRGYLVLG